MATTTAGGYAFPQFDDYDDPQNFAFHLGQSNLSDFVEYGLSITADHANEQFDLGEGKAYVEQTSDVGDASGETRYRLNYGVHVEATNGIGFATTSGVNYVWIDANVDNQDSPQIVVETNDAAPSDASLKIGTIDAANDTSTELNREPDAEFGTASFGGDVDLNGNFLRGAFNVIGDTSDGQMYLKTGGGGGSGFVEVTDDNGNATLARFNEGGPTAFQTTVSMTGNRVSDIQNLVFIDNDSAGNTPQIFNEGNSDLRIETGGSGTQSIKIWDGANNQLKASFPEGSNIQLNDPVVFDDGSGKARLQWDSDQSGDPFHIQRDSTTGQTAITCIAQDVGIKGITNPNYALDVGGSIQSRGGSVRFATSGARIYVDSNGELQAVDESGNETQLT